MVRVPLSTYWLIRILGVRVVHRSPILGSFVIGLRFSRVVIRIVECHRCPLIIKFRVIQGRLSFIFDESLLQVTLQDQVRIPVQIPNALQPPGLRTYISYIPLYSPSRSILTPTPVILPVHAPPPPPNPPPP